MIGKVIDGAYRVESVLGEGAFGVVYACRELQLDRTVAVKVLGPERAGERETKRFLAEVRNLASLNHPNVVHIYRFGTFEGSHYFAMEYLEGQTLKALVRKGPLSLRRAVDVMRQVATGLGAIHAVGILHHDLSPNNILVTRDGIAKIVDFGLSRDTNVLASVGSQNVLVGTLAYVAPEQVDGKGSSFAAEVFSFGTLLYESLTGRNPFWAEHHMSVLYNIAHRDPEPLDARLPGCPPALARLVHRCLERRPEQRPQSMAEIERALSDILTGIDSQPASSGIAAADTGTVRTPVSVSSSNRNPYLNRVMIKRREDFFGRAQEVRRIYARLNATPPGSISIVGDRKIGKSSLLNYVYQRPNRILHLEAPDSMVMVFLDLQEEKSMSIESFVGKLLAIADYELRGRLDVNDCARSLDGIKDLVQRLDAAGFRLAILLDEFDSVTTNHNFRLEFFSFLRFLANHYNVAYITSSARDLQVLCHDKEIADSPFFNIFSTIRLSTLQREEAAEMIRVPSERAGRPLGPHAAPLLEISGLFPFFVQMACCHAFEWLEEHPGATMLDFAEIGRRFYEEAELHYRYIWDGFDVHEKSAVRRVATGRGIPDALRHVVAELATKRYVRETAGKSTLFAHPFAEFVRTQAPPASSGSLWDRLLGRER
jgi:predicted Ser/Thr protein kinase